jgi:hypothetical protein
MLGGVLVLAHDTFVGFSRTRVWMPSPGEWHAWVAICGTWSLATLAAALGVFVRDRGDRFRVASYVVPAVGAALLLPLTIHMPIVLYTKGVKAFDSWVMYSGIFVLIAHIAFAALVGARAKAIVEGREPMPVHSIYGITVAMSCVPGLIVFVPVVVTALTGIPLIPLLFLMERWGERARHEAGVPVAVARIAS